MACAMKAMIGLEVLRRCRVLHPTAAVVQSNQIPMPAVAQRSLLVGKETGAGFRHCLQALPARQVKGRTRAGYY